MSQTRNEDMSHEKRSHRRMQIIYGREVQERQIFMEDLKDYRKRKDKKLLKEIKKSMGPLWYQALSVKQQDALDSLESAIYQDLLERRPTRTRDVIKTLGINPRPDNDDLMHCNYNGRDDPKEMLAQLFHIKYNHAFDLRRSQYDLNARLLLSAIFYLGESQLISFLNDVFKPDQSNHSLKPKKLSKPTPPPSSPYLQKMVAVRYEPRQWVHKPPPPLPNLDVLNEPVEESPPVPKPPPPLPPPPPPKQRIPISYCDKLAGIVPIFSSVPDLQTKAPVIKPGQKKKQRECNYFTEEKKVYGIGNTRRSGKPRGRKPKPLCTGVWNVQHTICGIAKVRGRSVYILGSVSVLPVDGEIIHGGHALVKGEHVNILLGIRGKAPPPRPDYCDCLKKWDESVFKYLRESKCHCGHYYDYYNEGKFAPHELPFFEKPTRQGPFQFRYDNIYNLDDKSLQVAKEFKKVWETDSVLHPDNEEEIKKKPQKKKTLKSSKSCLGLNPKPEDYLKCALYRYRRINLAARLPDIHLVPELVTWMIKRIHGPYTRKQKERMIFKSNMYWSLFWRYAVHGIPHVPVPKVATFNTPTTWTHKQKLNDKFRKFTNKYRLEMFRKHADFTNMLWPSMFQAQVPDKKFREIYFSYLFGTIDDLTLMRPYSSTEAAYRYAEVTKKPYRCPPAGAEYVNV